MDSQPGKPRVLIFSLRNVFGRALFRCPHFEFEDLICEMDSAELVAPKLDPSSMAFSLCYTTGLPYSRHFESGYPDNNDNEPI